MEIGRNFSSFQLRTISQIQRPAFFALAAVGFRRAIQVFALANVEGREMAAACQRCPNHALAVDINASRIEAGIGNSEDRGLARFRSVIAALQADEHARERVLADTPNGIINRTRDDRVQVVANHRVEFRIVWRCGSTASASSPARATASRCSGSCCPRSRSAAATGVALVEKFVSTGLLSRRVPRPRDLSVPVGIVNLAAPTVRGLLSLQLIVRL